MAKGGKIAYAAPPCALVSNFETYKRKIDGLRCEGHCLRGASLTNIITMHSCEVAGVKIDSSITSPIGPLLNGATYFVRGASQRLSWQMISIDLLISGNFGCGGLSLMVLRFVSINSHVTRGGGNSAHHAIQFLAAYNLATQPRSTLA